MSADRLVYSTDGTQRRDLRDVDQRRDTEPARVPRGRRRAPPAIPNDGVIRIFRERGGRGGKVVTVVRGLPERGEALAGRAAELKRLCGAGGGVKDGAVEIQGDHRERIAERLRALGYSVRLAGG
jgi:translation initiation factor 1